MSCPGRASSAFPLHVLVWNNDYRRLDEELRDQVTRAPETGGLGAPEELELWHRALCLCGEKSP